MVQLRHYSRILFNSAIIALFFLLIIICANNAVALSLKGTDVTFIKPGDQVPVDIIAENLENGISRYNISIVVDSPDVATISRLFFPVWAENRLRTELPSSEVWMSAEDVSNTIKRGTANTRLGMVMLSSLEAGNTGITLHVTSLEDDDNTELSGSGVTDLVIFLVPNKTITMASPVVTQTSLSYVTPTLTLKQPTITGSKVNTSISKNFTSFMPSVTNTTVSITSYYYETPLVTPEPTYDIHTTMPYFSYNTPISSNTPTSLFSITYSTQNLKGSDIPGSNLFPFIIPGILILIAFALLIRW